MSYFADAKHQRADVVLSCASQGTEVCVRGGIVRHIAVRSDYSEGSVRRPVIESIPLVINFSIDTSLLAQHLLKGCVAYTHSVQVLLAHYPVISLRNFQKSVEWLPAMLLFYFFYTD